MTVRFDKINDYRNFFFDHHYIHVQPTNSLATSRRQRFVCSLFMSVIGMIWLLNLSSFIVEWSQVFNLQAAENDPSSAALVTAFTRKKLAVRNVCLVFMASTRTGIGYFYFSLRTRTKSRFHQQSVSKNALIYFVFLKSRGGGRG